jgi:hypothetical protein
MPLNFPDILQHNNPNNPLMAQTSLRGVAFPIGQLSDTGSVPVNKRDVGAIVFATGSQEFYAYYGSTSSSADWNNPTNWKTIINSNSYKTGAFTGSFSGSFVGDGSGLLRVGEIDKTFYVAENGSDTNDGRTPNTPFRTIKQASLAVSASVSLYSTGSSPWRSTIRVYSGYYIEEAPITLPAWTSIVGNDLRTTVIRPTDATKGENMFLMNVGTYAYNLRFEGAEIDDLLLRHTYKTVLVSIRLLVNSMYR